MLVPKCFLDEGLREFRLSASPIMSCSTPFCAFRLHVHPAHCAGWAYIGIELDAKHHATATRRLTKESEAAA